jgi:hypothetical protein
MVSVRLATRIAAAALLAIAPGVAIPAGSKLAALSVRVAVKPSAAFRLELKTAQLAISNADVALGHVDLPASTRLSVSTGRFRPAVLLDFSPGMGPFKSVEVRAEDAGHAAEKAGHAGATVTALSFRLGLSAKAAPGHYRLPLVLNVDL